jgi:hypothetical protein
VELTISFVHPEGPLKGLDALHSIERALSRVGCKFLDHGTCFRPAHTRSGRRINVYKGSDTTMRCSKKVPPTVIRNIARKLGIGAFKVSYHT